MDTTGNLYQVLQANAAFVANRQYEDYGTDKLPDRRIVILTCMDTRLVDLLERAMNINQGDAKIIKVAGAQVHHPFGSVMHSILIAVHMLEADEIMVVAHHDCGMQTVNKADFIQRMVARGISPRVIQTIEYAGVDLNNFLEHFDNVYDNVRETVGVIAHHPFIEGAGIPVHGLVIDPATGKLELVVDGS